MTDPLPILRGNLDLLVLRALAWGPMHGYALTTWLEQRAGGNLELLDSALYQGIYRLESRGLIKAAWGISETNRRARFYSLTPSGRAELKAQIARWQRYTKAMSAILAGATTA